ncbi:unnamed protein product [Strongylus vulgaris]|uniref:Uncharacterized protein n=1 Tax=Strongylus vulgaris TaxID=40348 RepID=A0A3P7J5V4_STRVU|nr:unnamed protein product [Strongylus vulgaris]VDM85284.1 unnamed protein product [Strongylus vulgaris]
MAVMNDETLSTESFPGCRKPASTPTPPPAPSLSLLASLPMCPPQEEGRVLVIQHETCFILNNEHLATLAFTVRELGMVIAPEINPMLGTEALSTRACRN